MIPKTQMFLIGMFLISVTGSKPIHAQSDSPADLKSRWIEYTFTKVDRTYYRGGPYRVAKSDSDGKAVVENRNVKHLDEDLTTPIGYSSKIVDVDAESGLPFSDLKSTVTVIAGDGKMATLQDTDVHLTLGNGRELTGFQRKIKVFDGEHILDRIIRIGPGEKDHMSSYAATLYPEWVYHPAESYELSSVQGAAKEDGHLVVREGNIDHVIADEEVPYLLATVDRRNGIMHREQKYMDYHPTELGVALPSSVTIKRRTADNKPQVSKFLLDFQYSNSSESRFAELLQMATGH